MTEDVELETAVHDALGRLPSPRAPETLQPRIMAVVRGRAGSPWYDRAWLTWPFRWQVASGMAFAAVLVAFVNLLPAIDAAAGREVLAMAGDWPARLSTTIEQGSAALNAAAVLWRLVIQPMTSCLIALAAATSVTCAMTGAVLARVTTERMSGS